MKILIVGHGEYAKGVKSLIKFLTGVDKEVDALDLNESLSRSDFESKVSGVVEINKDLIIVADLVGGAAFQLSSRIMLGNEEERNHNLIGGASPHEILEIIKRTVLLENNLNIENIIENIIEDYKNEVVFISKNMF